MIKLRCKHDYKPCMNRVGDVGLDLFAPEGYFFAAGNVLLIKTGVFVEDIALGYWLQLLTPSGLATQGITVNGGVLDSRYRGEIGVILVANGLGLSSRGVPSPIVPMIYAGDKIAQLVIRRYYSPENISINGELVTPQNNEPRNGEGGLWNA